MDRMVNAGGYGICLFSADTLQLCNQTGRAFSFLSQRWKNLKALRTHGNPMSSTLISEVWSRD